MFLDQHPYVIAWQSEDLQIPYLNPVTGKYTVYIPDFVVVFADPKSPGRTKAEMWEVKPQKESAYQDPKTGMWIPFTPMSKKTGRPLKVTEATRRTQAVNAAKWQAAQAYCRRFGITFRLLTEETLFNDKK
jgi:hypothetical protein